MAQDHRVVEGLRRIVCRISVPGRNVQERFGGGSRYRFRNCNDEEQMEKQRVMSTEGVRRPLGRKLLC